MFPQKKILHTVLLAILCLAFAPVAVEAADVSPAEMAPDETLAFAQVKNWTELGKAWEHTPYFKMWTAPEFERFLSPLKKRLTQKLDSESDNPKLEELKVLFPGAMAVFLSDLRFEYRADTQNTWTETNLGFIAQTTANAERAAELIEKIFLSDVPQDAQRSTEIFRGVKIFTILYGESTGAPLPPGAPADANAIHYHYEYALVDDFVVLLEGQRAFMKKVLTNYFQAKEGRPAAGSLATADGFSNASRKLRPEPDVLVYANLWRFYAQLVQHPNLAYLTKMQSLRLNELGDITGGLFLDRDKMVVETVFSSTTPAPRGIAKMLIHGERPRFSTLRLGPKDAILYWALDADVAGLVEMLRNTVIETNEGAGAVLQSYEQKIKAESEVDLFADIFAQMGGECATITCALPDQGGKSANHEPASLFVVGLKDAARFETNLEKILPWFLATTQAPVELKTVDFAGFKIHTLAEPPPRQQPAASQAAAEPSFCFVVADGRLVAGDQLEEVKNVLRRVSGDLSDNLGQSDLYRLLTPRFEPGYSSLSFSDSSRSAEQIVKMVQSQPLLIMLTGQFFDILSMPSAKQFSRYFSKSVSASYVSGDTYLSRTMALYPDEFARP